MKNLSQIICKATFRNASRLKKICSPLAHEFGVDVFWYWTLTDTGDLTFLCNHAEISDFFFSNELFNGHPYFRAPEYIPTGFTLSDHAADHDYVRTQSRVKDRFSLGQLFVITDSDRNNLEGYGFATTQKLNNLSNTYLNKLFLFRKFINFFNEEANDIINHNRDNTFNIASKMDKTFYQPTTHFDVIDSNDKKSNLLALLDPIQYEALTSLSSREIGCIKWLLKGRTASQIGKVMNLSPRTVESYIENVKNKLGCATKQEIFDCLLECKDYLNFAFFN